MHLSEDGSGVDVVVDFDIGLAVRGPQDPADVLHDPPAECEREGEKQGVQRRAIESFAQVGTCCKQELATSVGFVEFGKDRCSCLLSKASLEDKRRDVAAVEGVGDGIEVFGPLGQSPGRGFAP